MPAPHLPLPLLLSGLLAAAVGAQQPAAPGWVSTPGEGLRYDAGEAFELQWSSVLQVRVTEAVNDDAPDTLTFGVRRVLTSFGGHVGCRNLLYRLQLAPTDTGGSSGGALKHGHLGWTMGDEDARATLRVGQSIGQYGLEAASSSGGLYFVERSTSARTFSDVYTRGAWLVTDLPKRGLHATLGVINGDVADGVGDRIAEHGEEREHEGTGLTWLATAQAAPVGDFFGGKSVEGFRAGDLRTGPRDLLGTVGAGLALGSGHRTADDTADHSVSWTANTAWSWQGFQVLGEYFHRVDDPTGVADRERAAGGYAALTWVQAASSDCPVRWGAGLRFDEIHTDEGAPGSDVAVLGGVPGLGATAGRLREATAIVDAFCHGHAAKVQFEYTLQRADGDDGSSATNHLLRIAFQLTF